MTVVATGDKARTMDFQAGDVGYVEKPLLHYIENTGDADLVFREMFKSIPGAGLVGKLARRERHGHGEQACARNSALAILRSNIERYPKRDRTPGGRAAAWG
jgi:hypothetical protein